MAIKRVTRKSAGTRAEKARVQALRDKYQQNKPTADEVAASGEYDGPVQLGTYWEVRQFLAALKAERERQGLSLAEVEKRSGIDKGTLSRLENGRQINPTVDTLARIAVALGKSLGLTLAGQAGEEAEGHPSGQTGSESATEALRRLHDARQSRLAEELRRIRQEEEEVLKLLRSGALRIA